MGSQLLPKRVADLQSCPPPKTVSQLRHFLGMLNFYRRFLPHAASSQARLHFGGQSPRLQQPTSPAPQHYGRTSHHTDAGSKDDMLRAHCTLPGSFHLSPLLRRGVMWGHPHRSSPSSVSSSLHITAALSHCLHLLHAPKKNGPL
jgi:hypothetical protein